jgi:serine/threonine protein kinase
MGEEDCSKRVLGPDTLDRVLGDGNVVGEGENIEDLWAFQEADPEEVTIVAGFEGTHCWAPGQERQEPQKPTGGELPETLPPELPAKTDKPKEPASQDAMAGYILKALEKSPDKKEVVIMNPVERPAEETEVIKPGAVIRGDGAEFLIKGQLGAGGMGEVYLAECTMKGGPGPEDDITKECAVKVIRWLKNLHDPRLKEQFIKEANLSANVELSGIITLNQWGYSEKFKAHYMAMDYVNGPDLHKFMEMHNLIPKKVPLYTKDRIGNLLHGNPLQGKPSRISDQITAYLIWQLADTLHLAHTYKYELRNTEGEVLRKIDGVLHRDISPSNVILSMREGVPFVLDLGVAITSQDEQGKGTLFGKPAYIAPECYDGKPHDARSDLYSLGVVWYEMMTGLRPNDPVVEGRGANFYRQIMEMQHKKLRLPHQIVKGCAEEPSVICGRLLDRDPDKRIQSAEELMGIIAEEYLYSEEGFGFARMHMRDYMMARFNPSERTDARMRRLRTLERDRPDIPRGSLCEEEWVDAYLKSRHELWGDARKLMERGRTPVRY